MSLIKNWATMAVQVQEELRELQETEEFLYGISLLVLQGLGVQEGWDDYCS